MTKYFLRLLLAAVTDCDARANGAAVGFGSYQLYFEPVIIAAYIVSQQRGRLVHVHDQNIRVAIVVEVSKGATTASVCRRNTGTGLIEQFFKLSVFEIAE